MLEMLKIVLLVLVLLTSVPAGYLLARLCHDELKVLKKWFFALEIVSAVGIWVFVLFYDDLVTASSLFYIGIVSSICLIKARKNFSV